MSDNTARITFRMSQELFDKIKESAQKHHRSANAEMIVAIEEFLKSQENALSEQEPQKQPKQN